MLETAIKNRRRPSDNYKADTGKLTGTQLFYDLDVLTKCDGESVGEFKHLYTGSKIDQAQKNAAHKFKVGKITQRKSSIYCINDRDIVDVFDNRVRNNYAVVYAQAVSLARLYFEDDPSLVNVTLVQKVLLLILNDSSISDDQVFYICSDGSTKKKSDLINIEGIEFEAFLLGVWHYLIVSSHLQVYLNGVQILTVSSEYKKLALHLSYGTLPTKLDCTEKTVIKPTVEQSAIIQQPKEKPSIEIPAREQKEYYASLSKSPAVQENTNTKPLKSTKKF